MRTFRRAWAIAKKDMRVYYLRGPVLIFGIFFPTCLFFAFAMGRGVGPEGLVPGLLGMSVFFAGSAVTPAVFPFETRTRTLERLLTAPLSLGTILAGDVLAAFFYGLVVSIVALSVGLAVAPVTLAQPLTLVVGVLLSALCFAILGALFSVPPTDNPSQIMTISNLVRLPMIFISGVFVPVSSMAGWGRALAAISPLTYTTELVRAAIGQTTFFPPLLCIGMLALFCVVLWIAVVSGHRRTIPRRL